MNPELSGLTRRMAKHIAASTSQHFQPTDFDYAKVAFADWLSVGLAAREEELVSRLQALADDLGGKEQATIIGAGNKVSVTQAALINGAMTHALDFDDTSTVTMMHASTVFFPALMALAENRKLTGRQVLTSFLVGLHAGGWLAQIMGVPHYERGWHGTATIGRTAAAAACAHLLALNADQTCWALGIAATETQGLKQSFGTMCKPYHAGLAAQGGVTAALLAEKNFDASEQALEGPLGLIKLFDGEGNSVGPDYLNGINPVEQLFFKFHAACHCTHGPIDIARELAEQQAVRADQIESVALTSSQISVDNASKSELTSGLDGKFSMSYSFANSLITGKTGMAGYTDDAVKNPEVLNLMKRISVDVDETLEGSPLNVAARIQLKDGTIIEREVDPVQTHFDLATRQVRVEAKFFDLTAPVLGEDSAQVIYDKISQLDTNMEVNDLLARTKAG